MCGIIGYTGSRNSVPIIIEGLKRLEYRGYDSSGIACQGDDGIDVIASKQNQFFHIQVKTANSTEAGTAA